MQAERRRLYMKNEWFTSTSFSYVNGSYVMRLILPQSEIGIDQVLRALSESDGNLWKNVVFSSMSDIFTYISLVQQVTRLKVDEEGSAITVIEGDLMSPLPEEEVDFFLDRPFLFQILEPATGTVLFMGQVGSPE